MITSFSELRSGRYIYFISSGGSSSSFADIPLPRYGRISDITQKSTTLTIGVISPFTDDSYTGVIKDLFTLPSDEAYSSLTELQLAHPELFI